MSVEKNKLTISAFGFRAIPPQKGSAGADKFAFELYTRLADKGYEIVIYNRVYPGDVPISYRRHNFRIINLPTVKYQGFDSFIHSLLSSLHIIFFDTAKIVHIHNGGNSIFALLLKIFGRKSIVIQDGLDWGRAKWSILGKVYLYGSSFLTAYVPNRVVFDNIFAKKYFESKFNKKFSFIPFGAEVSEPTENAELFDRLNIKKKEYFLFIGRFIPDKGVHYLIEAFEKLDSTKKLVIVGGSPNMTDYERMLKQTKDSRISFPGYIYGDDVNLLIKNAFLYVQPSEVEGLSPLLLTVMYLGTPLLCSDIPENIYAAGETSLVFQSKSADSLNERLKFALDNKLLLDTLSRSAQERVRQLFSWEKNCEEHAEIIKSITE